MKDAHSTLLLKERGITSEAISTQVSLFTAKFTLFVPVLRLQVHKETLTTKKILTCIHLTLPFIAYHVMHNCCALFHSNVTQLLSWFRAFYDKESWQNSWVSKNATTLFCMHSTNWIQAYNPLLFNLANCIVLTTSNLDTNHKQKNSLRHWGSTIASLRRHLAVPW